jgi:hypothetical protein
MERTISNAGVIDVSSLDRSLDRASTQPLSGGDRAGLLLNRFQGALISAGDPGYDHARKAWNLTVDQRPALIAIPQDAQDVA